MRLVVPAPETRVEEVGDFGRIYFVAAPQVPILDSRYRWMLPHTYAWRCDSPLRQILAVEQPELVEVCDKFLLLYLPGVLRRQWIPGVPVPVIVGLSCERLDDNMRSYVSDTWVAQGVCARYMRSCYVPRFDFHVAASDYIAAEVKPLLPERLRDRLHVCPMGVDFEAFRGPNDGSAARQQLLRRAGAAEGTKLLLYAGRLSKEKNLLVLPEVLARLAAHPRSDYRLIVAGDGPLAGELQHSLEKLAPERSLFVGHCERNNLRELYHAGDVFLHPNPREPFGIAPLEAMAAGLPLVAPASGGVLTYANEENAWLCESTAAGFAGAVESVHTDAEIRRRKIAKARRTAEEFSWTRVTADYFQLYDQFHEWPAGERRRTESAVHALAPSRNSSGIGSLEKAAELRGLRSTLQGSPR